MRDQREDTMKTKNEAGRERQVDAVVRPRWNYDEKSDVLYISFGEPVKCESREVNGLLHRYTIDNKLNGITIVDFKQKVA